MSTHSRQQRSRSPRQRNQFARKTARIIERWPFPLSVGIVAFIIAAGIVLVQTANARADGSSNLKQQAATMQAQWMAANSQHPAPKKYLAPGTYASCATPLNQPPIVVTSVQAPGAPYHSYINVISSDKHPYSILGEMNKIIVIKRQIDMCNPHDTPVPPRDYVMPGQPGQITLIAVQGDVVTFTTASGATGRFNYVTGQYLGA